MMDGVVTSKAQSVERCMLRVRQEYGGDSDSLTNMTKQDSSILNLQRASQAAIDLAMHVIVVRGLEIPQTSREAFAVLGRQGVLEPDLALRMERMVGLRNLAVHDYQRLDMTIVRSVIETRLGDFADFVSAVVAI